MMKELVLKYKCFIFKLGCSENNTHIEGSHLIREKEDMREFLKLIKKELEGCEDLAIFKRSDASMLREWRAHNFLFTLGYKVDHTRDVDFEAEQPWYTSLAYLVLSALYPV